MATPSGFGSHRRRRAPAARRARLRWRSCSPRGRCMRRACCAAAAVLAASVDMYDPSGLTGAGVARRCASRPTRSLLLRSAACAAAATCRVGRRRRRRSRCCCTACIRAASTSRGCARSRARSPRPASRCTRRSCRSSRRSSAEPRLIADIAACAAALQRAHARPSRRRVRHQLRRRAAAGGRSRAPEGSAAFDYVVALGAHHDLRRLARYYAGSADRDAGGRAAPAKPHPVRRRASSPRLYAEDLFAPPRSNAHARRSRCISPSTTATRPSVRAGCVRERAGAA